MMAERLQRRRTKGYRLPEGAVSVTRPGRYGNPWELRLAQRLIPLRQPQTESL